MSVQNGERLATKQDLADMYSGILPYLGGMPEVLANKFSKGDLYSTDEKMIGQWIDGKPLYQKTFDLGKLPNNSGKAINTGLGTTAIVHKMEGYWYNGTSARRILGGVYSKNGDYNVPLYIVQQNNDTIIRIECNTDWGSSGYYAYATLQYTKSTDSAISIGSDTDYSTEEKIIGTWIDGKPLYQKTVSCGALPNSTNKAVAHNISNFSRVISITGYAHRSDGNNQCVPLPCPRVTQEQNISVEADNTNITIRTGFNWGNITDESYVTLQYTKSNS